MEDSAAPFTFQPQPSDVLIAVMGITGSGKSTFISHCTDETVSIGEGLHSHTHDIVAYPCRPDIGTDIYLIDTPGFDDTERDDAEILKQIATWVGNTYEQKIHIRGILYLHRITDVRMQGAAIKNLFMFKKLCGKDAMRNVILTTTMWEEVRQDIGQQREQELRTTADYWGEMIKRGSRMARHHDHYESARSIIHTLLDTTTQTTLAIQKEMVDEKKDLHDTSAGKELDGILTHERERFTRDIEQLKQDMAEARELQDKESQEQIRLLQQQRQAEIANLLQQQESMKVSLEQLHEERFAKLEQLLATQIQRDRERLEIAERERLANASLTGSNLGHNTTSWDATKYSRLYILEGYDKVRSMVFSPDSCHIASGWDNGTIRICDSSSGRHIQTFKVHKSFVSSMAYSPDGSRIASTSGTSDGMTIKIWNNATAGCIRKLEGDGAWCPSVAYSPDGRHIASVSGWSDRMVRIWDGSTGRCVQTLKGHGDIVWSVAYSPDGLCIASGSRDHTIKIWDLRTESCIQTIEGCKALLRSIAYSPDGRCLALASVDGTVKIWSIGARRCLQTLKGHEQAVLSVAYSPDGHHIASGSCDGTAKIWDSNTGRCLQTLEKHEDMVFSVAYSPDGRYMALRTSGKTVKIWIWGTKLSS